MDTPVRTLLAVLLVAVATIGGALSLQGLVETASWLGPALGVVAVSGAVVVVLRSWWPSLWLPTVAATIAGGYTIVAVFAPGRGLLAPLPGLSSGADLLALARQGVQDTATAAPVLGSSGLALWIVTAVLVVFLLAEAVAVGCRAPAWAGLVLLAPWAPAVVLEQHVPLPIFLLAAGAYLGVVLVLALRPVPGRPQARAWRSAAVAASAAVLVAVLAAPGVLHLPAPAWLTAGGGGTGATRLDLGLDVGEHLVRGADELLYSYRASDPDSLGPLHAYTLSEFTGSRWVRRGEPDSGTVPVRAGQTLWPTPVADEPKESLQVHILDLGQDRLLLPDRPRQLTIAGDWAYHAASDEVIGSGPTPLDYQVDIVETQWDPLILDAAGPGQAGSEVDPSTLQVPDTGHQEQIHAVAQRVTESAGAQTPYAQAVALQDFLRHDSQFTYDVQVDPARTSDAVWDFLGSGRGYCVQFATAMVVMARTLDIPARMAVGFLEGEANDDGGFDVSAHRAHTWPQLHFEGIGWVRFEPTPPTRTGAPPPWALGVPEGEAVPEPEDVPDVTADAQAPQPDTATDTAVPPAGGDGQTSAGPLRGWTWLVLGALLTVIGASLAWWRRWRHEGDVERWWKQIQHAARDIRPHSAHRGETPQGLADRVALSGSAAGALSSLVRAVERHRYGRPGRDQPARTDLRRWRDEALAAINQLPRR